MEINGAAVRHLAVNKKAQRGNSLSDVALHDAGPDDPQ
jgi:hypothetical protein